MAQSPDRVMEGGRYGKKNGSTDGHLDLGRFLMFQWKARLAALMAFAAVVAAVGGDFDWLHWGW
jgi:hypothetical protein